MRTITVHDMNKRLEELADVPADDIRWDRLLGDTLRLEIVAARTMPLTRLCVTMKALQKVERAWKAVNRKSLSKEC